MGSSRSSPARAWRNKRRKSRWLLVGALRVAISSFGEPSRSCLDHCSGAGLPIVEAPALGSISTDEVYLSGLVEESSTCHLSHRSGDGVPIVGAPAVGHKISLVVPMLIVQG